MARSYSLDLRERVVAAVRSGHSCRGVAATFGLGAATVVRWWQRYRDTGDIAAKARGGSKARAHLDRLAELYATPVREAELVF